jgi:hypothetical protein
MPVKSDLLLRLLIADLVGERATRESIVALRDDLIELPARLDHSEANTINLPPARLSAPRDRRPARLSPAPRRDS